MTFEEALDFLYKKLPMFSRQGKAAVKKDLKNTWALCEALGNPQHKFKSVHVAGTNGKGSVSHMLASVLQEANYKVGLYTSPHLQSFTERIRISGVEVSKDWIAQFVSQHQAIIEEIKPSFFEITVAISFAYFAEERVDIAVVETGLGGRLDSTNVITPELSIITNIGLDHMDMLGDTLEKIAAEKAGIIKEEVPVIISETQKETEGVFFKKAHSVQAPIIFADRIYSEVKSNGQSMLINKSNMSMLPLDLDVKGAYQIRNARAVILAVDLLNQNGFSISKEKMLTGLSRVKKNTNLRARFEIIRHEPLIIFDVAHNKEGVSLSLEELQKQNFKDLHIIYGCVNDKDVSSVLPLFPANANFYWTQADVPRALDISELESKAAEIGIKGKAFETPKLALQFAKSQCQKEDCILVIGSFFILETLL
jgi:dihydrofolate synthase/folylpolyglutamate synthase